MIGAQLFRPPGMRRLLACLLLPWLLGLAGPATAEPPDWADLTPVQRQALAPLQRDWAQLDPRRKEKWLAVASRFSSMSADERQRLQARMTAWSRMTPAERAQARLRYQETRQLPAEEKQARWRAYQALSDEERRSLAQRARPPARSRAGAGEDAGARAADRGTAKSNLVTPDSPPPARSVAPSVVNARPGATTTTVTRPAAPPLHHQPGMPKIAATPGFVDQATLLPQRGPQGAAVRGAPASAPARRP